MARHPADRHASIAEFAVGLTGAVATEDDMLDIDSRAPLHTQRHAVAPRRLVMALAATTVVSTVVAGWALRRSATSTAAPPVVTRATVSLPDSLNLISARPTLSADGRTIAFLGTSSGRVKRLFVRPTDGVESRPVLVARIGAGFNRSAYWGSDGQILIASGRALLRVPASGGRLDTLYTYPLGGPVTFVGFPRLLPDGKAILFTAFTATGGSGLA